MRETARHAPIYALAARRACSSRRAASVAQDARKKRCEPHARAFARGCAGACAKPHGTRPYTPSRSASRTHAALRRASVRARVPWRAMGRRRNREGTRRIGAATQRGMHAQDARAHARKNHREKRDPPCARGLPAMPKHARKNLLRDVASRPADPFPRDGGTPPRGKRRRARKHRARPSPAALCDRRGRPSRDGKKPSREARGRACKRALPMRSRATAKRHLAQTRALARSARTSRLHATGAPRSVL